MTAVDMTKWVGKGLVKEQDSSLENRREYLQAQVSSWTLEAEYYLAKARHYSNKLDDLNSGEVQSLDK